MTSPESKMAERDVSTDFVFLSVDTKIPTENNENFTKRCGISKIICDTASHAIYLNTRLRLRLKG